MARRSLYVFTAEMALKIVAQGFVLNRGAYLRDVWNWLDFTVVVSGWVASVLARELSGDSNDLSAISALRAIRVLRPLRTINRVPGMKVLVRSLLGAIPAMASVLLLCGFIFLVFGIIGVQLFAGALHDRCHDELVVGLSVHARACLREQPAADDELATAARWLRRFALRPDDVGQGKPTSRDQQPSSGTDASSEANQCAKARSPQSSCPRDRPRWARRRRARGIA